MRPEESRMKRRDSRMGEASIECRWYILRFRDMVVPDSIGIR